MKDIVEVPLVFFFEVEEEQLIERILARSLTSGRNDDNLETLKKRLHTFIESTMPIVEMYEKEGKLVRINGHDSIDEVYTRVKGALNEFI